MPKITKILCVGNNSADTDMQCKRYAKEYQIEYQGLLLSDIIDNGCYHTSPEDVSLNFIKEIYDKFDKVIFLKQNNHIVDVLANSYFPADDIREKLTDSDILFVGCSHTAGIGHSDKNTVYTHQFAKILNLNAKICGYPGRGNYAIEDELARYNLTRKKVVIQFTEIFRIRYFSSKSNTVIHKLGHEFTRNEVELFDEHRLQYEYLRIVDRVVSRLRDANAQFLFFYLPSTIDKIEEEIDIYQSQYKEFCYMRDVNLDLAEDHKHYGVGSHKLIAKELNRKWSRLYAKNS